MDLLRKFEDIIIVRTIIFDVNLNFLCLDDLTKISDIAYECKIDLNHIDLLEGMYNSQYDKIRDIYDEWREDIVYMYNDVKDDLLEKLNG